MTIPSSNIVQRVWNYCNVLRDDGTSYGDYVEQLTYLLFLKMAEERVEYEGKESRIPEGLGWRSLLGREGDQLDAHYRHILATLGQGTGLVQHVKTILEMNGRAAVVVPDNVLFEGGAGEAIRRSLLHDCDVHTLLRLPTGIFYAQGVKANVLFFDKRPGSERPWTEELWIYDLRTNKEFSLKQKPLSRADLDEFVACYNPKNRHDRKPTWSESNPEGRWRSYTYEELLARDKVSLDIFWLRDQSLEDSASLPEPDVLAAEIVADLQAALEQFAAIAEDLDR